MSTKKGTTTKAVKKFRDRPAPRPDNSPLSPAKIEEIERRYQVVCLRRDGHSIYEIAKVLNCSDQTVRADLVQALSYTIKETAETTEENRQLQIDRLDQLLRVYTPLATQIQQQVVVDRVTGLTSVINVPPNPVYANLVISIEQRRAKLLALDVPETKKLDVTGVREYIGVNVDMV